MNIGDTVVVVNTGKVFATYEDWAIKNNLTKFCCFETPKEGNVFVVKAIGIHEKCPTAYGVLLGVCDFFNDFIIEEAGVKKL